MRGRRVIEKVEPTAFVGPHVKLGRNNYIGHYAVIEGEVTLGDNNDHLESAFRESMDSIDTKRASIFSAEQMTVARQVIDDFVPLWELRDGCPSCS